jgi:N4-gp56 family major capsid protein
VVEDAGGTAVTHTLKYTTVNTACDIFCTLIFGQNAYGVTPLAGNALKTIIKALGSGGTADPMDQRSTAAWKAITSCVILNDDFMYRYEHGVSA